jgi:hypothetical protein
MAPLIIEEPIFVVQHLLSMAVKVLVTEIGQQLIADVKQVENKDTNEVVGYWLKNPRVVVYNRTEDNNVSVGFGTYCLVSDEQEFSVRANHIVAILEGREDVVAKYEEVVYGPAATPETLSDVENVVDEPSTADTQVESPADLLD